MPASSENLLFSCRREFFCYSVVALLLPRSENLYGPVPELLRAGGLVFFENYFRIQKILSGHF